MSITTKALKGVNLTLLASVIAASPLAFPPDLRDGLHPQISKAFAKDGERDDDDDDGDRGGSGKSGKSDKTKSGNSGKSGGGRSSSDDASDRSRSSRDDSADRSRSERDDAADKARSSRDDAADKERSRRDDSADRARSSRDESDDRRGGSDDGDDNDDDRRAGRGRGSDDDRGGRSGGGRAVSDASGGAGLRVTKMERSGSGIEVEYSNGVKEEIENGRYEMKNAAGRTVLERRATQQDVNRIQSNARASGTAVSSSRSSAAASGSDAGARLPSNSRASRIEIVGNSNIEVSYNSGWKEEVAGGRYEMKDPANRTVVERSATSADLDRLMGLAGR